LRLGVNTRRRVVLVAPVPVQILDVAGPAEVFGRTWDVLRKLGKEGAGYSVLLVSTDRGGTAACTCGLRYVAPMRYTDLRGSVDTLLVAGGDGATGVPPDKSLLAWLRRWSPRARRTGSVCTGAFLLAAAGLLDGRRATTHWQWCGRLARDYPRVAVTGAPIFVKDGPLYTSAGVTAGIDLALAMVEEDFGAAVALQVAKELVLHLRRSGGQSQFSALLGDLDGGDRFGDLRLWVAEHLNTPLSVEALAERARMSPRHFARMFRAEVGVTPARFVERLRIEAACRRLEQSTAGLKAVAEACGFGGPDSLRRSFVRRLQVTPDHYRARFRLRRSSRRADPG
jgi:transcriptional regulator GlxA family with amidase domain